MARKQLLLLESDLNRAQFIEAMRDWRGEYHRTRQHLADLSSMASTAAKVAATVSTARRIFSRKSDGSKKSWISLLFDGVTAGTSLWYMLRSRKGKEEK